MSFYRITKAILITIVFNIVLYLLFAFLAEKYSLIFALGDNMEDYMRQSGYRYLWQACVWPSFALIMGSIAGYLIRNQQQKIKCLLVMLIVGLISMISIDISFESHFPQGAIGFLKFLPRIDGKFNLTFLSVVMWPIAYAVSLVLISMKTLPTKRLKRIQ